MKDLLTKLKVSIVLILLVCSLASAEEDFREVEHEKIPDVLRTISEQSKQNFEKIHTWQGELQSTRYIIDKEKQAKETFEIMTDAVGSAPNEVAEVTSSSIIFRCDLQNGLSYSKVSREAPTLYFDPANGRDLGTKSSTRCESHVTCSNVTNAEFPCPLNYCLMSSSYEPNEPLYFSAFNNSGGDVTVNVYADCGILVWSQIYSGGSFFDSIPAEITGQHEIDYVSFDTTGAELLAVGGRIALSDGGGGSVTKVTDPASPGIPYGNIRALIILPDLSIIRNDSRTIMVVQKALKDRNIEYEKLILKSATYDNVALYAAYNPIKYMYIGGHGTYKRGDVLRTVVGLADGPVVSMKQSDFPPGGAPSWCESLGGFWDDPNAPNRSKSFYLMGFTFLEYVQFDTCYSGRLMVTSYEELIEGLPGQLGVILDAPVSDMSLALGMHEPTRSRCYHGWYDKLPIGNPLPYPENDYQKWTRNVWEKLGDEDNLDEAIDYAISQQTNFHDPNAPVNAYRLKGTGLIWDIFLRNN
ncbi:MAG: hypothetical protein WC476_06085 [Phycisphaerae bacterium]